MLMQLAVSVFAVVVYNVIEATLECFANRFIGWIQELSVKLKNYIRGILIGHKTYIDTSRQAEGITEEISKNYARVGEQWEVTTASRTIGYDEIPPELKNQMVRPGLADVTGILENIIG